MTEHIHPGRQGGCPVKRLICRLVGHDRIVTLDGWEGPGTPFIYRHECERCGKRLQVPRVRVVATLRIRNSAHAVQVVERINTTTRGHNR